jgi:4-amino-4-deoxy-L-arabinose transferase-like glycosyltransferase
MSDTEQQPAADQAVGRMPGQRVWLPVLVLLLLGCALYLPRLGASGLWDPWEPRYAQAAREMAAADSWIVPQYRLDTRLNKPPLTYWLIALSHSVLGVNETAARLPSALLAVLCAASLGLAFASRGRPLEGLVAGAALLTGPQWLLLGRFATPDIPLAAFLGTALALVLLLPSVAGPRPRRFVQLAIVVLIAAAALTDWPRGLLLPAWGVLGWGALRWGWKGAAGLATVAAVYHAGQLGYSTPLNVASFVLAAVFLVWILHARAGFSIRAIAVGSALLCLLVAPWFVLATQAEPDGMKIFTYKHALNLGESVEQHTGPYGYVVRMVALGGMPWTAAAVVGLILAFRRGKDEMAGVLAGAWIGATLFFTLSEAQMGHFYGVMQPALAGLAGIGAVALARKLDWSVVPAAITVVAIWFVAWKDPSRILETATVKRSLYGVQLSLTVSLVVLAWVLVLVAARVLRRESWVVATTVPAIYLAGTLAFQVVPELEPKKSLRPMWNLYLEDRKEGQPIGAVGQGKDSGYYYSNNAIVRLKSTDKTRAFLSGPGTKYLIGPSGTLKKTAGAFPGRWEWLDRSHSTHRLVRYVPVSIETP